MKFSISVFFFQGYCGKCIEALRRGRYTSTKMGTKETFNAQGDTYEHENTKEFAYQEFLTGFVKNTWYIIGIIVSAIGTVITLWIVFPSNLRLILLGLILVITFGSLLGLTISLIKIIKEQNSTVKVSAEKVKKLTENVKERDSKVKELAKWGKIEFFDKEEDAVAEAIKLLEKVEKSLYYFGGAGFISDNKIWKGVYREKLGKKEIKIVRVLDIKSLKEMEEILEGVAEDKKIRQYIADYKEWLELHSEYLRFREVNNIFYKFEGSPLWKFGINHIIFDERDICIVFLSEQGNKNAIFIYNSPHIAKAIKGYIKGTAELLELEKLKHGDLEKYAFGLENDLSEHARMGDD